MWGMSPDLWRAWTDQKGERKYKLSLCFRWNTDLPWDLMILRPSNSDWNLLQALRPSNNMTSLPGSPACRGQIVGLLNLHNWISQYPLWVNIKTYMFLVGSFLWRQLVKKGVSCTWDLLFVKMFTSEYRYISTKT